MRVTKRLAVLVVAGAALAVSVAIAGASTAKFTNQTLFGTWDPSGSGLTIAPDPTSSGDSEPAIAFANNGAMAVDGLGWLPFQVNVWRGTFGSTPSYFGALDQTVPSHGNRLTLGDEDADIEFTSANTMLLADLNVIPNPKFSQFQLGVDVVRCPAGASASGCTSTVIDQTKSDRPWITHRGTTAWVAYHDNGNSALIHVQMSTDDGRTWQTVSSPIAGQGGATGAATFNNIAGPIVADPNSNYLYDVYAAGTQQSKCCSADFNNVYVSRSTDGGKHWDTTLVATAPVPLDNIFPSLAVDQTTGQLYAVWSDGHDVWLSSAPPGGAAWTPAKKVSSINTALLPWVAARAGKVDVVYYGSTGAQNDPTSVWNVYDSQSTNAGASFDQNRVSSTPNRVGAVCTGGDACAGNVNRELLDLFEVAENPTNNKAAIIYTSSEISTYTTPDGVVHKLPEVVLAYEQ
ncbi:MAG TPA: hypothetical protein VI408_07065 [Gaiellaceae bacterium]